MKNEYHITTKKLNYEGDMKECFFIKRTIFGIPFYKMDLFGVNNGFFMFMWNIFSCFFTGISFALCMVSYTDIKGICILLGLLVTNNYICHIYSRKRFFSLYHAKTEIEKIIKNKLSTPKGNKEETIFKYAIEKDKTVSVEKQLN